MGERTVLGSDGKPRIILCALCHKPLRCYMVDCRGVTCDDCPNEESNPNYHDKEPCMGHSLDEMDRVVRKYRKRVVKLEEELAMTTEHLIVTHRTLGALSEVHRELIHKHAQLEQDIKKLLWEK